MQTIVLPSRGQPVGYIALQNVHVLLERITSTIWTHYARKSSLVLGLAQIVIGLFCMLFNASADVAKSPVTVVGYGVWGGVFVSELLQITQLQFFVDRTQTWRYTLCDALCVRASACARA